ncbi:MAG TPA: PilT/PilU family type 4a pilus ATPase [Verrucomicrobiae bacterium]|jgi:twitching motility protein PilT|nr:PilT/PilU family type 4a pilus ATPase [Verrucomicrobiae bacterium]
MTLESLITTAAHQGASDLHLEAGLPAALRIRGSLRTAGEPIAPQTLAGFAREILGEQWPQFLERRSADLSKTISGVRCRINILQTARGIGFAIRLLAAFQATLETLNLHPDFKKFIAQPHGLILISGPTGSGKSSTLAALIQEINLTDSRHIVTIESPIEYTFRPRHSYIRQREVGRDTPSFEQALLDALREDPDVLMVGEMREPETMRLTLNASETGHLVLATVHSSTCAEAIQRIASAFPAEIQASVCAQLADCLIAVISQRLVFRSELNMRVPECEVLVANHPVKNFIRTREFFKIASALETGADHGMWSLQRYRSWLQNRKKWHTPNESTEAPDSEPSSETPHLPPMPAAIKAAKPAAPHKPTAQAGDRIEIEPEEGDWGKILKKNE